MKALQRIEQAIRGNGQKIETESRKSGQAFSGMAAAARNAASTLRSAFDGMANAVGMLSPKLGFALQTLRGFAAMVGGMASSLRSVASGTAAAGNGFRGMAVAVGSAVAVLGTLTIAVGGFLAVLAPLIIAFKALSFAVDTFKTGLRQAGEFEAYTTRFAGMLGSMEEAEKRMKSLASLADKTPFELDEIVRANISLESLTNGLWSGEKAMLMIGDASAKSGLKIDDFAERIGRVFTGIRFGGEWLEPLKSLAGAGGIGGEVASQMKAAIEQGKTLREVWAIAEASMAKFSGQMQNLSTDFVGRSSTMSDAWAKFTRILGQAILPAAKDVVIAVTDALSVLASKAESILPALQGFADKVVATLMVMTEDGGFEAALKAAADTFETAMNDGFTKTADRINKWMLKTFGVDLQAQWNALANLDVWATIENDIIPRIGRALVNAMINAIMEGLNALGEKIHGLWDSMTFGVGGAYRSAVESMAGGAVSTFQGITAPSAPAGVVSDVASANAFMDQLPFMPDDGQTFNLDESANLLPELADNTAAVVDLTETIEQYGPAQEDAIPIYGPAVPDNSFKGRLAEKLDQLEANREATKASRKFLKPEDQSAAWDLPTGAFTAAQKGEKEKSGGKSDMEKMMDEGAKIADGLRTPSEEMEDTIANLQKLRDAGAISADTFTRGVAKAKEDYEDAMDGMTKAGQKAAKEQEGALASLMNQWGDLTKQIDQSNAAIAQSISSNLTGALVDWANGTKSASQAFSEMAASIVNDILRIITQMMVQYAIQSALGMVTGGFGGGAAMATAAVKHAGGMIGEPGPGRVVDAGIFRGAERFHRGGTVGLAPGEVPVIAEKGEAILTEDQQARLRQKMRGEEGPKAPQAVTILNVTDPRQIDEQILKNPDLIMNAISRRMPQLRTMLKQA